MIAEMNLQRVLSQQPEILQWGRDRMIAEIAAGLTIQLSKTCATACEQPSYPARHGNSQS
jgi:hypothetical protein